MHCLNRYVCKEKEVIRKKMTVPKSSYHLDNYQYVVEKRKFFDTYINTILSPIDMITSKKIQKN